MVTAGGTAPDVPSTERAGARGWSGGLRMGAGFATATLALAVTFGALARDEGWSLAQAVVASLVVFSGSAQFALLTALAGGGGAVAADERPRPGPGRVHGSRLAYPVDMV